MSNLDHQSQNNSSILDMNAEQRAVIIQDMEAGSFDLSDVDSQALMAQAKNADEMKEVRKHHQIDNPC
ncbi:MAG: hypothetical protein AAF431_04005 [Pseudomonadota bacterium]